MSNTRIKEINNNNYFINNIDFSIKNNFGKKINVLNNRNKEIDSLDLELDPYVKKNETLNFEQTSTPNIDRVFEEDSGLNFDIVRFLMSLSEKQSLPSTDDKNYHEAVNKKAYESYSTFGEGDISPMYEYKTKNKLHMYNEDGSLNENVKCDKEGFAYIKDERNIKTYIVAMGTQYVKNMEDKFLIEITDDNKKKYIQVIAMNTKADEHTDNKNMYTYLVKDETVIDTDKWGNPVYASETSVGGMIEFATIDKDVMSESTNGSGDCSDAKDILKGEITSIYKIKINDSYLKEVKV